MAAAWRVRGFKVWSLPIRLGHWALALSVAFAWFTRHGGGIWHEWAGYAALGLIALRIAYGWVGTGYARFTQFIGAPATTLRYARLVWAHREPRYLGHNPLGGWMVLALLANTALVGASGWLYTTDAWWGDARMESLHHGLSVSLLVLIALHVAGVVMTSIRHRENLVAAMLHGRKRPPANHDLA